MRARIVGSVIAVVLVAAAPVMGGYSLARADNGACSGAQHSAGFRGYSPPPASWNETPEGVLGNIVVRSPAVCVTQFYPYSFSTAWVMLYSAYGNGYTQTGYMRRPYQLPNGTPDQCKLSFSEYNDGGGGGSIRNFYGSCLSDGATLTYAVRFTGPPGPYPPTGPNNRLQMKVGGIVIATNGADPWLTWSFTPAFYGETTHETSDIPGTATTKDRLYNLSIQSVDTGAYRSLPCYMLLDVQYIRYHAYGNSCTDISIWTA